MFRSVHYSVILIGGLVLGVLALSGRTGYAKPAEGSCTYYWNKIKGVRYLNLSNSYAILLRGRIRLNKIDETVIRVKLRDIYQGHHINRPEAVKKLEQRIEILRNHKSKIIQEGVVTAEFLDRHLSSKGLIQVLPYHDKYFVIDGNGRLVALSETFKGYPDLMVEVHFINVKKTTSFNQWITQLREVRDLTEDVTRN